MPVHLEEAMAASVVHASEKCEPLHALEPGISIESGRPSDIAAAQPLEVGGSGTHGQGTTAHPPSVDHTGDQFDIKKSSEANEGEEDDSPTGYHTPSEIFTDDGDSRMVDAEGAGALPRGPKVSLDIQGLDNALQELVGHSKNTGTTQGGPQSPDAEDHITETMSSQVLTAYFRIMMDIATRLENKIAVERTERKAGLAVERTERKAEVAQLHKIYRETLIGR